MKDTGQHEHDARQIKAVLDAGLGQLDPSITARLREGRLKALEQAERPPFVQRLLVGHPRQLAGFATAAVLLAMVLNWYPSRSPMPEFQAEEMEMAAQQGNLEMYKDLEFYRWLAQNDATH